MTEVSQAAIDAADKAVGELPCDSRFERDRWRMVARVALEAAAPLIAVEAVRFMTREQFEHAIHIHAADIQRDAAKAERERIRQQFSDLAAELEREHEPAAEPCKHAEGIRIAASYLAEPEDG